MHALGPIKANGHRSELPRNVSSSICPAPLCSLLGSLVTQPPGGCELDVTCESHVSLTLAWKIPWTEEPGRLHAVHGVAEGRTRLSNFTFTFHFPALEKEMATHSSVLAWRIPAVGEPGGLPSMGSHRVGHD